MISLIFVCSGNICRSPAMEAVFALIASKKGTLDQFHLDSCGIHSSFVGSDPDPRMQEVLREKKIPMNHKVKLFQDSFLTEFDYIICATPQILSQLKARGSEEEKKKVYLATDFTPSLKEKGIPDPYYFEEKGFEVVLEMIEKCSQDLYDAVAT